MYNRYIRSETGAYTRVPQTDGEPRRPQPPPPADAPPPPRRPAPDGEAKAPDLLARVLGKLHLEDVDTGDALILLLLFYLFRQDADEELLVALGLLLIL